MSTRASSVLWLLLIGAYLLSPLILGEAAWLSLMDGELGLVELVTCVALVPVIFLLGRAALQPAHPRWLRGLCALMALGAFYFLGEEASWGQHYFGFEPSNFIAANNRQQEFNLHNSDVLHDLFNELPRTLAGVFCVVLCAVLPLLRRRFRSVGVRDRLVPNRLTVVPGALVGLINLPERVLERVGAEPEAGPLWLTLVHLPDEVKEMLMAVTLCLWAIDRTRAWKRARRTRGDHAEDL